MKISSTKFTDSYFIIDFLPYVDANKVVHIPQSRFIDIAVAKAEKLDSLLKPGVEVKK